MTNDSTNSDALPHDSATDNLTAVLRKLAEITRAASSGLFVFRGEPECYEETSSSLYREYKARLEPIGLGGFDIRNVQDEILEEAARYAGDLTPSDLLSQLQHYGHPTNLIDFTTDYLIALFFACASEPDHDGRVILLNAETAPLSRMRTPVNRIKAQKSVFVNPPSGIITPDETILIPRDLKSPILDYLNHYHDIRANTIYDDIHGYIKNANIHRSAYAEFYIARLYVNQGNYTKALEHYNNSVTLNRNQIAAYGNRGLLFLRLERYEDAIRDFTQAIALEPQNPKPYLHRAIAFSRTEEEELAEEDYGEAIQIDKEFEEAYEARAIARAQFHNLEGAIEDFSSVIRLNQSKTLAYSRRGLVFLEMGNYQRALSDLTTAIELDSTNANDFANRAQVHFDLGEYQAMIEDYRMYITLNGDSPADAHFRIGIAQMALANFAEARTEMAASLDLDSSVAQRMFETEEAASAFVRDLGLQVDVPADLLAMLTPKDEF